MTDEVWELHRQGLSPGEIANRTGRTRNAIIGHIWRYKKRGGPAKQYRLDITEHDVRSALGRTHGSLSGAATLMGVTTQSLRSRGFKGSWVPKKTNTPKDQETAMILDEIDASGLSDEFITRTVYMGRSTIRKWRRGLCSASPFLVECVREVIKNSPGS